ncbi:MAG: class I SAM-dependent methyltransferase [Planctomycetaceae bacterium]
MANVELNSQPHQPADELSQISTAYSDPGWWYNLRGLGILTFAYRTTVWSQVGFLERNVSENHLEIPVGTGTLLKMVLRWRRCRKRPIKRIVAVDYSETMVGSAKRSLRRWPEIEVRQGDVANLPFPDADFDSINVANGFHCFPDPDGALRELWRVVKPGGTVATNVLLQPRGSAPLRWVAQRVDDWGKRKGLLVDVFNLEEIRGRFKSAGFRFLEDAVRGNTVNILAQKAPDDPTSP